MTNRRYMLTVIANAIPFRARFVFLLLWFRYAHHQPLLRLAIGEMDEGWRRILGEVLQPGLHDRTLLIGDRPGDSLALFVGHSFDCLHFARQRIFERPRDDALLADGQLQVEGWRSACGLAVLRQSKDAERQPIGAIRRFGWRTAGDGSRLISVFLGGGDGLVAVVNLIA